MCQRSLKMNAELELDFATYIPVSEHIANLFLRKRNVHIELICIFTMHPLFYPTLCKRQLHSTVKSKVKKLKRKENFSKALPCDLLRRGEIRPCKSNYMSLKTLNYP